MSDHMDDILPLPDFSMMVAHPRHKCYEGPLGDVALVSASICIEPTSYKDALVSPQSAEWKTAMQLEFDYLTSSQTWDLVPLPAGRRVVNSMWVYKAKTDASGAVSRYKARFVAKGCSQREGIDYTETFSPVIRLTSLRVFFNFAAARDLELGGLDIDTVFMYAPIKEDVYIRQPLGFDDGTTNVCHMRRCMYGLKQSPREFSELRRDWLVSHGWRQLMSDPCIYIFEADGVFAMIALYVDDIPVACNNTAWRVAFTALVRSRFDIKDQGDLSDIIGMHIIRDRAARTISLDQGKYVRELLDTHDMVDCKPSCLPMDPSFLAAIAKQTPVPLTDTDRDIYPSLLGSLQYAAVYTRPSISTALSILDSAQANPTVAHMQSLWNLKGSPSMSMTLGGVRTTLSN
jgi:hypothetical protein